MALLYSLLDLLIHLDQTLVARCRNMKLKVQQTDQHDTLATRDAGEPDKQGNALSIKVVTALDEQNRVMCILTSTTAMIVVVRGGIVVVFSETLGGSSSLRLVLY